MLNRPMAALVKNRSFAWNDIEALPAYGAVLMGLVFLLILIADLAPDLTTTTLKAVGVFASIALRNAWLNLNDETMEGF